MRLVNCLWINSWLLWIVGYLSVVTATCTAAKPPAQLCSKHEEKAYRYFSAKTAYDVVRYRGNYTKLKPGCEPVLMYVVARHGSRFNITRDGHESYLDDLRSTIVDNVRHVDLSTEEMEHLRQWKMRMSPSKDMELSSSGWLELKSLGRRLQKRFPAMRTAFRDGNYDIRHTNEQTGGARSRDSARAFVQGLYGTYENITIHQNSHPDWFLQYYVFCQKFRNITGDKPCAERHNFVTGVEYMEMLSSTAEKLGLPSEFFNESTIFLLYETCRFEYGIYRDSPWCAIFTKRALQILEFVEDVRYYWMYGHAEEINYEQACPLVKDLYQELSRIYTDQSPRVVARFGHSGTFQTFLTRLGFFKDESRLRASGFKTQLKRKWRNSIRFPMGGNVVLLGTSCPGSVHSLSAFVNEQPVLIPGCDRMECPLEKVLSLWSFAENCDIAEICGNQQ